MTAGRRARRRAALGPLAAAAVLAVCGAASGEPGRSTPDTAADRFTSLVLSQDTRPLCRSITARLLAELGGRDGCARRFGPDRVQVDRVARQWLTDAWRAAVAARGESRRPGYAAARTLLRAMRPLTGAVVRLVRGPGAVRGRSPSFVGLDRKELRAGRLVLYAESDTGTIFRLVADPLGSPVVERTAAAGIPDLTDDAAAARIPRTIEVAGVGQGAARAVVTLDLHDFVQTLTLGLVLADGEWLVDRVEVDVRWQPA
jgi:hypothetical protein